MTSNRRLDPLSFTGSFAELESDLPVDVTLQDWRTERTRRPNDSRPGPAAGSAAQGRTRRARARRPRSGRGPDPKGTP